jgi:hypothetical protein
MDPGRTFQVAGTQTWGLQDYRNYSGGDWTSYRIPVGEYVTGSMQYLVLVNDHDVSRPSAQGAFRNVRLSEPSSAAGRDETESGTVRRREAGPPPVFMGVLGQADDRADGTAGALTPAASRRPVNWLRRRSFPS